MPSSPSWRKCVVAMAALGLVVVSGSGAQAAEPGASGADDEGIRSVTEPSGHHKTVTLVTGDVVDARVDGAGRVLSAGLRAAEGADHGSVVWQDGQHTYVVPDGVQSMIDAGRLDLGLFDVTTLIASGYDDAHRDTLPVIVQYAGGRSPRAAVAGTDPGVALPSVGGAALSIDKDQAAEAWDGLRPTSGARAAGSVRKIWLDAQVHGTAVPDLGTPTVPLTGAPQAHARGVDGTGVTVAVLDTGYDLGHPDLAGQVTTSRSFIPGEQVDDLNGHGTHTASTVAGTGAASDGRYAGMAPGADLMVGKVLDNSGSGATSGIIAGMQWAVAEGADIVSMSLGNDASTSCNSVDTLALEALSDRALFVVAAGNSSRHATVSTPGCSPAALTVGALDRKNMTAPFSSRGPAVGGDWAKPDIASQGVGVVAANAGGREAHAYAASSGTSMATPHVAGAAALALQDDPNLTPAKLKAVLTSAAAPTETPVPEQGAGPLDIGRAVDQTVFAAPNQTLGDFDYPQADLAPTKATITLTNRSDQPAELDLSLSPVLGDDGETPVEGLVGLATDSVVVPAAGTAAVSLDLDPTVEIPAAAYGVVTGRLLASGTDGQRVVAPYAVHLEEPSANLTVRAVDRHGDPAADPSTFQLFDEHRDTARRYTIGYPQAGSTTIRVPHGAYALSATVMTRDEPGNVGSVASLSQLYRSEIDVDGDTTVTLDARDAEEITWKTNRPSEAAGFAMGLSYEMTDDGAIRAGFLQTIPMLTKAIYAEPARDDRLAFVASARLSAPRLEMTSSGGHTVDDVPVQLAPEFSDGGSAELVHIGKGSPENFAKHDIDGKVVLLDAGTGGGNANTWSTAAVAGGAVGVLAAVPDSVGRFQVSGSGAKLPQITVTWQDSLALQAELAEGPVTMSWSGTPLASSPYLYNLARYRTDAIVPGVERVGDPELARVDADHHTQGGQTTYASNVQVKVPGLAGQYAGGTTLQLAAPLRRTEFYTADPDVAWTTIASRGFGGTTYGSSFDGPRTMTAGSKEHSSWFKAPYGATRNTYDRPMMSRTANRLSFAIAPYGDAGGHDSTADYRDNGTRQLLLDGVPHPQTNGQYVLPQKKAEVTFRQTWARPISPADQMGLAYRAEWRFPTSPDDQGAQPLLVPVVDVPSDLTNQVPSGTDVRIPLAAVMDTEDGPLDLARVSLDYAFGDQSRVDEVTGWTPARVQRTAAGWFAIVPGDAAPGTFAHLRVSMADGSGSEVDQTMVRAFRTGQPTS
ncbi:S8 family serine peptidase [Nocardioides albus]|uniref:Subtilisin family serine protease n=1 Tax=Nocardioides albus TaxID=1841 RepID=A0A7W5F9E3_9ACTN|nr:S8 family serine peptidase [Nocardioides albus]MBB3090145.1 subtilisin family serine protease [Nocardioides albus]GGU27997.1 peptidase [Nocardioides albus]